MTLAQLMSDPALFRQTIKIDCDGQPKPFASVMDRWQRNDFLHLDDGWLKVTGQQDFGVSRAWLERGRGHSKSSDVMLMVTWALFAARRQLRGIVCAADRDQARLDRDHVARLVQLNPWLSNVLSLSQYKIVNKHTESEVEIITSDVASSWGLLIDFAVCDEITVWPKRDLFDSVLSAIAKRRNALLLCIGNAGFQQHWAWEVREQVRRDPDWYFSRLDGPRASWIDSKRLDEQRRLLPSIAYRRLWLNEWSAGSGDALSANDIDRAVTLKHPARRSHPGWAYFGGLDLGVSRDRAALVLIGKHVGRFVERERPTRPKTVVEEALLDLDLKDFDGETNDEEQQQSNDFWKEGSGKMRLARVYSWSPTREHRVDLSRVEQTIQELHEAFRPVIFVDPWQAESLIQRLERKGVGIHRTPFSPSNLRDMASATLEAFSNGSLSLFEHRQLIADLHSLRVEEKSYGVRLVSPRGPSGHGDAATSLSLALLAARQENRLLNSVVERKLIAY